MTAANTQELIIAIENAAKGDYRGWTIGATHDPAGQRLAVRGARGWKAWKCCCRHTARNVLRFFEARGMRLYDLCEGPDSYVYIYAEVE